MLSGLLLAVDYRYFRQPTWAGRLCVDADAGVGEAPRPPRMPRRIEDRPAREVYDVPQRADIYVFASYPGKTCMNHGPMLLLCGDTAGGNGNERETSCMRLSQSWWLRLSHSLSPNRCEEGGGGTPTL